MPVHKKINKNFFKEWNPKMAYVLGILFADGNIVATNRGAYYFAFHSSDKIILQKVKKYLGSEHKVSKRSERSGYVYRLQIGSKEMVNDLSLLGLNGLKTKRMLFPDIPKIYQPYFILGYFDGDGNVWMGEIHKSRKKSMITLQTAFTSGSSEFLKSLHKLLKYLSLHGGSVTRVKNKDCGRLSFSMNDSLKLYKIMYNTKHKPFCLQRKRRVFERFIKLRL